MRHGQLGRTVGCGGEAFGPAPELVEPRQELVRVVATALGHVGERASLERRAARRRAVGQVGVRGRASTRSATRSQSAVNACASDRRWSSLSPAASAEQQRLGQRVVVEQRPRAARPSVPRTRHWNRPRRAPRRAAAGRPRPGARSGCAARTSAGCRWPRRRGRRARRRRAVGGAVTSSASPSVGVAEPASNSARSRSRNSAPAFSVNVTAAMCSIGTPARTVWTTRSTRDCVLPDPAPASTNSVSSRAEVMRDLASASASAAAAPRSSRHGRHHGKHGRLGSDARRLGEHTRLGEPDVGLEPGIVPLAFPAGAGVPVPDAVGIAVRALARSAQPGVSGGRCGNRPGGDAVGDDGQRVGVEAPSTSGGRAAPRCARRGPCGRTSTRPRPGCPRRRSGAGPRRRRPEAAAWCRPAIGSLVEALERGCCRS